MQILALLGLAPTAVGLVLVFGYDPVEAQATAPLRERKSDYVGAGTCRACHADHTESWHRTHHASMTQLPSESGVLGHFDGAPVTMFGSTATPSERDGRYLMQLPAMGSQPARRAEVALSVGSRRYQQYFERTDDHEGITYRRLPLLWHVGEARWMHVNGIFLEADSDDWSAYHSVWNANCIFCHNTGIKPGLRDNPDGSGEKRLDSHVADLGIACEACHGPGRRHAERNASPVARYASQLGLTHERDIVDPLRLGQRESVDLCGQCHSQRLPDPLGKLWTFLDTGPTFRPGGRLTGHVKPVTRETLSLDPREPDAFRQRFWNDGTARLTAYEYLGTTQSPCFAGGKFTCSSCHTMHGGDVKGQIEPEMRGDRACTQCHGGIAGNVALHTHHRPESSGSRCLECHMPRMAYGILAIHRSHRVESPDVKRDVEGGRPNACTECHLDKTAPWAAQRMRDFWGSRYEQPQSRPDGASLDIPEAVASLHAGDAVVRAVYAEELGRVDAAVASRRSGFALAHAIVAMGDAYPAIRYLARQSALRLDVRMGLGLRQVLTDFDTLAPRAKRDPALRELIDRFQAAASTGLEPPPAGALIEANYTLDLPAVLSLLSRQADHVVSIGE